MIGWLALGLLMLFVSLRILLYLVRRQTRRKFRNYTTPIQGHRTIYRGYDYAQMTRARLRAEQHERERRHLAAMRSRPQ